jgi:putative ABC transport system permease protein
VLVAARQTLVSYQQEVVRAARRPIWQRLYLDVLVLLAAGYGYYTLRRQGSLVPAGSGDGASGDPFTNPLSLLLPATALLGSALLLVRLFPALATLLARLGRRVFGASTLLALRHLARSPEQGRSIVLLTALTLGLGTFSASMATTLDQNDEDRVMYATGARLRVTEQAQMSQREKRWTVLPAWEHGEVPGVSAWSRVRIEDVATAVGGGGGAGGSLLALDRAGYHAAGWWRSDLAQAPLGSLMNTLAAEPHALIVSRRFLQASRLRLGDDVSLTLGTGERLSLRFVIRAAVDNFPMIYPKPDQFFFIGNFDYIYQSSEPGSYDVLLDLEPGADPATVVEEIRARDFDVSEVVEPSAVIEAARTRPERVGFVGLLSLGFVAAAALTMLALLLYGLFSFRRRMVEIGVLRAAGLSLAQLVWLLVFELCFLVMTSAIAGTALGVAAARLFVPFYQLGTTVESRTPPFIVVVAWSTIGRLLLILAVMLGITLLASTLLLRRLRIHEAIKLGQELG